MPAPLVKRTMCIDASSFTSSMPRSRARLHKSLDNSPGTLLTFSNPSSARAGIRTSLLSPLTRHLLCSRASPGILPARYSEIYHEISVSAAGEIPSPCGGLVRPANFEWMQPKSGADLLRLDAGRLNHLAPPLRIVGDELAELSGRACEWLQAQIGEAGLERGIDKGSVHFLVELVDDLCRRVLRRADALPAASLVAGKEIAHGRNLRQHAHAGLGRHRERPQPAGPDVADHTGHRSKENLYLAAKQSDHRRPAAAKRHVDQLDPGHLLEQLAVEVRWSADPDGRHRDLARIGVGVGDELRHSLDRNRRIEGQNAGVTTQARDGRDIATKIETEIAVDRRIPCVRRAGFEQRVTVGRRPHDHLSREIA